MRAGLKQSGEKLKKEWGAELLIKPPMPHSPSLSVMLTTGLVGGYRQAFVGQVKLF